jgi:membrane-associated protease RseP (regulator of RpoE activity)
MNKDQRRILLQAFLFLATVFTTTFAGAEFVSTKPLIDKAGFHWDSFVVGFQYSIPFLLILTTHEFGHYFTAMYHKVKASLPFFIPFPILFGTLGAVIIQEKPAAKKQSFDIGIAGPLAGFVVAMAILIYGFTHLPPADYIFQFHPEYKKYGLDYADHVYKNMKEGSDLSIGKNLMYYLLEKLVDDPSRIPNPHEIMHYPLLFAGFLSLVFTFLNLMPIGQLDGGHILYGLLGHARHKKIATIIFIILLFYTGLGIISPYLPLYELLLFIPIYILFLYSALMGLKLSQRDTIMYAVLMFGIQFLLAKFFPTLHGYPSGLLFVFMIGRFVGVEHPPCEIEEPLDLKRKFLGWLALLIFVLCFSPAPVVMN